MRYLIDFSYDGKDFCGYQKQPKKRTIEDEIEKVLSSINDSKVVIYSSGRTDKGVNALHQTAHFDMNRKINEYKLKGALNSYLPDDIYINDIKVVDDKFHARYDAKLKVYEYKINTKEYNPIKRGYIYQYGKDLNLKKMKKGIKFFIGIHDFTTFVSAEDKKENKVRTIKKAYIKKKDGIITITFIGDGFLKYQVRNMVGTLIKIGEEKVKPNIIQDLLLKKDRRKAFLCAPSSGLTLKEVRY